MHINNWIVNNKRWDILVRSSFPKPYSISPWCLFKDHIWCKSIYNNTRSEKPRRPAEYKLSCFPHKDIHKWECFWPSTYEYTIKCLIWKSKYAWSAWIVSSTVKTRAYDSPSHMTFPLFKINISVFRICWPL